MPTAAPPQPHTAPARAPESVRSGRQRPPQERARRSEPGQAWGNQALQSLLHAHAIQAKLTVNAPGDRYEQEADRVAAEVLRAPAPEGSMPRPPAIQRRCSECEDELHRRPEPPRVQRACAECEEELEEERMQAQETPGRVPVVTPDAAAQIASLRGGGRALPASLRAYFEPRFGYDFGSVRLHDGASAAAAAQAVHARAFTMGHDIFFGAGELQPGTDRGRTLLAHELTHTVQQGAAPTAGPLQRAPADDCGDPAVPDDSLNCEGKSRDGPGVVVATATGWDLRNFDVDKHFLKQEHRDGLTTIFPALKALVDAKPGQPGVIGLVGEASTTADTCYNLRLSRRRVRCVARALEAMGIPSIALDVNWIGDIASEHRLATKPVTTASDIENPDDRRVSIALKTPSPKDPCPPDALLREATVLDFRFGCRSRDEVAVVIADTSQSPTIFRPFVWTKLLAVPPGCAFFPDLDPAVTSSSVLLTPVRLAWTLDPDAPSDFDSIAIQRSTSIGTALLHMLEFESHSEETAIPFPGSWHPASCEATPAAGGSLATIGRLKPDGPVACGPMPLPKSVPCEKPPEKEEEDCPEDCRESTATRFRATTESLPWWKEKVVDLVGDQVEGSEIRFFKIGTSKTDEEKKKTCDDIWRPYVFAGKIVYGPSGCEQRSPQASTRGEATTDDPESLDGLNVRPATLTRTANSNVEHLWITGFGTFKLLGETCPPGGTEVLVGSVVARGGVKCEPLKMDPPPEEKTCEDDCPEARRTCPDSDFLFRFGRIDQATAPPEVQELLAALGCDAEAARVNIGTMGLRPIWRPFIWVQEASCPFRVRNTSLVGGAGKLTVGVKPKLRFKWPPITAKPVFTSEGLRLATRDPDDPRAPTEFPSATELSSASLTGSGKSTSIGLSGLTRTYYKMATLGAPVDWTGSCKSSDTGILVPAGKVDCGWAPSPPHEPAQKDPCPTDAGTILANTAFLAFHGSMLGTLGSRAGILTQLTAGRTPLYAPGDIVPNARFIGQVHGRGGKLEPVVVVFDMEVLSVVEAGGRIHVQFTVLSEPCTYRYGIERVPLRLFSYSCAESIRQGQTHSVSNALEELPKPGPEPMVA